MKKNGCGLSPRPHRRGGAAARKRRQEGAAERAADREDKAELQAACEPGTVFGSDPDIVEATNRYHS